MKKTRILLILIGVFIVHSANAQNMKLPERKHSPSKMYYNLRDYVEYYPFEYSFGYSITKFTNSDYGENTNNSDINQLYGYHLNVRYNKALPLIFELGYSSSVFETTKNNYFDFEADEKITFSGLKAGANLTLLPSARFFMPYLGVGYGYFSSQVGNNIFSTHRRYYNKNFGNAFWKAGASINFHEIFFVNAEYEQSFSFDKESSYNQLNIGIGFRLEEDNVYENHRDYIDYLPVDYSFGYSLTKLTNSEFAEKNNNSSIKQQYGYYFNMRFTKVLPLIFDIGYKKTVFKLDNSNYYSFNSGELLSLSSFEGGINLTFPARNFLIPYVGIGAGYNTLSMGTSLFDDTAEKIVRENKALAYWKSGFTLNLHQSFFINAEYKQTFENKNEFSHNQFNAGIGFRINGEGIFTDNVKDDFKDEGSTILTVGYHQTDFLNSMFKAHMKESRIKRAGGASVNLRIAAAYPVMFDIGYFSSKFKVEDLPSWQNDTAKVRHRGGEFAILMPLLSKTRYFIPYAGLGYQYSQLYTGEPFIKESGKNYDGIVEMATNTSSPIYKIGLMINFKLMSYSVEFKHSAFNDKWPFYQLAANIGFKF